MLQTRQTFHQSLELHPGRFRDLTAQHKFWVRMESRQQSHRRISVSIQVTWALQRLLEAPTTSTLLA